jgi:hypothetical protein
MRTCVQSGSSTRVLMAHQLVAAPTLQRSVRSMPGGRSGPDLHHQSEKNDFN